MKKHSKEIKGFILGVLFTLILGAGLTVAASPQMREIIFGISVSFDGELLEFPEDSQPFTMDGRTFLPVRAVANIFGVNVAFVDGVVTLTTPPPPPWDWAAEIQRGSWHGDFFVSEHLGFAFGLPQEWSIADEPDIFAAYDMAVTSPRGASVRIGYTLTDLDVWDFYRELYIASRIMGMDGFGTVFSMEIGNYEWLVLQTTMAMDILEMELNVFGHYLINVENGIARVITILSSDVSESVEEIFEMFIDM